jgi:hypothetical protein
MSLKINDYYDQLNSKSQEIFKLSQQKPNLLSKVHSAASDIYQLSEFIPDSDVKSMLKVVCSQLESSCLTLALGLYRPAIGALRLALELGIGCIYFSTNKLLHREWLGGSGDLKWSIVNSEIDGVFSERFATAFFIELRDQTSDLRGRASRVYRSLSEYVHGNNETWQTSGIALINNENLRAFYEKQFDEVVTVIKVAFCCRYLKELTISERDTINMHLLDLNYIACIRQSMGGPEEIK